MLGHLLGHLLEVDMQPRLLAQRVIESDKSFEKIVETIELSNFAAKAIQLVKLSDRQSKEQLHRLQYLKEY